MEWLEVSVQVVQEAAEAVAEVLSRYAPQGVAIDLGEGEQTSESLVTVKAYLVVDEEIENRRHGVEEALWHLRYIWPVIPEPVFTSIDDQDWTAGWKETIPVLHLGKHVVIKPSWRDYAPQPDDVVLELDPGMAFGTGLHPTTQLCVQAVEALTTPQMRVLDLGTGTGILGLVAAKVGAAEVVAVDTDINAVTIVRRNARVNDVAHLIRVVHGSLDAVSGAYDLVLANILAPVILEMAQSGLATRVRPGGMLVVSGILVEQAPEVTAALEAVGLLVAEQQQSGDWMALVARRAYGVPSGLSPTA